MRFSIVGTGDDPAVLRCRHRCLLCASKKSARLRTVSAPPPRNRPLRCEDRSGGPNGNHTIVVTFPGPIASIGSASCAGQPATTSMNGSVVTVNCSGVPNAQDIAITLTNVSDGTNTGNVSIPMGCLPETQLPI